MSRPVSREFPESHDTYSHRARSWGNLACVYPWEGFPGGYDNWKAMRDHFQKLRGRMQHGFPTR